jgi:hypothetical protein
MAAKYSILPSELLQRGNTTDIHFHVLAETHKERERKKQSGDVTDIADSYTQAEIEEVYKRSGKTIHSR